ncbi:Gfo/Idh/MocA family oxidoreductase [Moorella naiadis]|uniref:Gfo/Idh/MocA family protein n=1 Tax=Moorella naiadis (nom. illeg.) TaxID=3093670 RepID=UPI003D9C9419
MAGLVKLGVVGCGYIAQQDYLPVLVREDVRECVELTAVCDRVPGRAEEIKKKYGAKEAYEDYDRMLAEADPDVVAILTPIPLHYEQVVKAIKAGKHVYVQKSMTVTFQEAMEVVDLAEKEGIKLCASPGQMLDPYHLEAKRLIDAGAIGKVCFVRGHGCHPGHENQELFGIDPSWYYAPGGGPVRDVAVYPLTSITGILGPAKRVSAFSGIAIKDRSWNGKRLDVTMDDNTVITLDFGDGVFASVEGSFCMRRVNTPQIELYGAKGVIQIGHWARPNPPLEVYTEEDILGFKAGWYLPLNPISAKPTPPIKPTAADLLHLVECVRLDRNPVPSGAHAMHVIEIIEKAYESAVTGRAIELTTVF